METAHDFLRRGPWAQVLDGIPLGPAVPPIDSGQALAAVMAAEAWMAEVGAVDLRAAYLAVFADDGRMSGSVVAAGSDDDPDEDVPAYRPARAALRTLAGEASTAGDAAWTYGAIDWSEDGNLRKAHYVRVWRRRPDGWKLVFDELLVREGPPPALN